LQGRAAEPRHTATPPASHAIAWTKFGRDVYAVGGNQQSALLMGLNVKRTLLSVYTLNGLLTAIGGFLFCLFSTGGAVEKAWGLH
jgi:simple sugar transport system permease protein